MVAVALYQPEIPPNTGNIIRLCANTGSELHLIHPLGFSLDDKQCRRAGLDYHEWARVIQHDDYAAFKAAVAGRRIFACTTKATLGHHEVRYQRNDILLMGPETRGLPADIREACGPQHCIRIPMKPESRSLNLSNATAVILFEAWRQLGFEF